MFEQKPLDGILDEKQETKVEEKTDVSQETPVEKEVKEPLISRKKQHLAREFEAQGRNPDGTFKPKEEPKAEPKEEKKAEKVEKVEVKEEPKAEKEAPKQEFSEKERAFLKAAQEERQKRQELERRLAALESQKPENKKTFWDDPEGALKQQQEQLQQQILSTRINTAEMIARSRYQDFDDKVMIFKELVQGNPALVPQWLSAPDPAEFAYRTAKNHKDIQDAGGIDKLIEKARAEERAKVAAELKAKAEAEAAEQARLRASIPTSLSNATGTGSSRTQAWTGPTSLDGILGKA